MAREIKRDKELERQGVIGVHRRQIAEQARRRTPGGAYAKISHRQEDESRQENAPIRDHV